MVDTLAFGKKEFYLVLGILNGIGTVVNAAASIDVLITKNSAWL